jgi:hypothetical protein
MSGFPGSPRILKGALVTVELTNPIPKVIVFQYNPASMTRSIQSQRGGSEGAGSPLEAFRIRDPPAEMINLEIELDAADKLEFPEQNSATVDAGILPDLSALETLLFPASDHIGSIMSAAASGVLEVVPPEGPMTLFVWGSKKILPVQLIKFDIIEEAFDTNLNPTRAKVQIGLRILTYLDLRPDHPAYSAYSSYHQSKEAMAQSASTSDLSTIGIKGNKFL